MTYKCSDAVIIQPLELELDQLVVAVTYLARAPKAGGSARGLPRSRIRAGPLAGLRTFLRLGRRYSSGRQLLGLPITISDRQLDGSAPVGERHQREK